MPGVVGLSVAKSNLRGLFQKLSSVYRMNNRGGMVKSNTMPPNSQVTINSSNFIGYVPRTFLNPARFASSGELDWRLRMVRGTHPTLAV
jgi:hypothetical protein